MRDRRLRVVLEIVRRQPVLVRADEGLEEQPGAPSDQTVFGRRLRRLGRLGDCARKADLASNPRCREPQQATAIHPASGLKVTSKAAMAETTTPPAICR